ncbi:MAG: PcfJ domain-containing protein, partial [Prevotellaceae bacterium]|nr:PcfJ domain-containing protein [Prevotellaceae bacterium]
KPDSLILSACINGQKIETVEFSLSKMQVVQSRGVCNKNTEYHDRIIELVKKNIRKIRQRMAA